MRKKLTRKMKNEATEGAGRFLMVQAGRADGDAAPAVRAQQPGARRTVRLLACILIALVVAGTGQALGGETAAAAEAVPDGVSLSSVKQAGTSLTVSWQAAADVTGYQIQYADNRLFLGKFSQKVKAPAVTKTFTGLAADDTYYVRIRTYRKEASGNLYSAWTLSSNAKANKTVTRTPMYKKLLGITTTSKFEIRRAAKTKYKSGGFGIPGYDTVQGSCYGGGYAYFCLENRNIASSKPRCKIVKVDLANMKIVKASAALKLSHGNDMTYDSKRKRIVVAHSTPIPKCVSIVNPSTLKVTATKTVELPDTIEGISKSTLNKYKKNGSYTGFGAIAYNASHDQFVVTLRGQTFHHLMVLDSSFRPVRFIWLNQKTEMAKQMLQGMDSVGQYIMVGESYGYGYTGNKILIYDYNNGDLLSTLNLGTTYELESIFRMKGGLYASYYTSYYNSKKKLQRDNFIYKLTNF